MGFILGKFNFTDKQFSFPTTTEAPSYDVPKSYPNVVLGVWLRVLCFNCIPNVLNLDHIFTAAFFRSNFLALAGVVGVMGFPKTSNTKTWRQV